MSSAVSGNHLEFPPSDTLTNVIGIDSATHLILTYRDDWGAAHDFMGLMRELLDSPSNSDEFETWGD